MYQYPRESPKSSSPAGSPQTNPTRTNNQRDQAQDRGTSFDFFSHENMAGEGPSGRESPPGERPILPSKDAEKLRQVICHFFTKAALTIISSRVTLPQSFYRDSNQIRANKWFNLVVDDSDSLLDDLEPWTNLDLTEDRPIPLVVEIYLDTAELARNQTLVIIDDKGRKWDAVEALSPPNDPHSNSKARREKATEIILERWKVQLGDPSSELQVNLGDSMPNVYKKAVILFRSLFTYSRFLPAWKFGRQLAKQPASLSSLRPCYRILRGNATSSSKDTLGLPLYPTPEPTTENYHFAPTHSPAGPLSIKVAYRSNCNFRVVSSEALMSSQFIGMDDEYFRPSLGDTHDDTLYRAAGKEVGSLPATRRGLLDEPDHTQAYGSLSTFHQVGPATGTSPLSALRAARMSGAESPPESPLQRPAPRDRGSQGSKSSLRSIEGGIPMPRRVSVSFQPFKAGSLSSSPAPVGTIPPSPGAAVNRSSSTSIGSQLAQARNRTSSNTLPQAVLRVPQPPTPTNEIAVASPISSSPKPMPGSKYSSSFTHRRSRISSGGGSRGDDDNLSSGKESMTSSNQHGSDGPGDGEAGTPTSVPTDDDNISDFLKLLQQKKELRSFTRTDDASKQASASRTAVALSKYQRMRESHGALTDSLSSSMMLQRSSSSSSRQLSSVPPMVAGSSMSTSSSPGKPVSPHTPHTPAVPSRLSAHANIDDPEPRGSRIGAHFETRSSSQGNSSDTTARERGSGAIDIPTSPGQYPRIRRSSSVAQRQRVIEDEYGIRSASLPIDERPDLSISEMLAVPDFPQISSTNQPEDRPSETESQLNSQQLSTTEDTGTHTMPYRPRIGRNSGRGGSSAEGSSSSIGTGSRMSERAGRSGFSSRPGVVEDEEPLLFTMSELGSQTRRSLEDAKSGSDSTARPSSGQKRGGSPWL